MGTQDISRSAFDPRKRYAGVCMQQGRVTLDEDWNAEQRIAIEDLRRGRVEIVGPVGSPDDGFRITNPRTTPQGQIDFDIDKGAFYLGGLRLEAHETYTYLLQEDLLQLSDLAGTVPKSERFDLVVLEAYQQPVTAVEDKELFEVALGGPDTTTRLRTMQRVRLYEDVDTDTCQEAWRGLLREYSAKGLGSLNDENELVTNATLTVSFADPGVPDDLCTPTAAGGYLGAENQAIRIQLVDSNHFTWGFNNAAPLYRVQAEAHRKTLTMLTEPKAQEDWPLADNIVEVLPWADVLPNNEKVAGVRGHLTRVSSSYNPDTGKLVLADPIPTTGFDDWRSRADAVKLRQGGMYYYMRVWNRGSDRISPPAIRFIAGTAVPLGQTGLEITLNGTQFRAADYWIIAARPETPRRVVPWELESGRSPHGIRRFYAPLALIQWQFQNGRLVAEVHDCRPRFRPLTRQKICCQLTVGDGKSSFGDFNSIEETLQHLPASGGEICLLPGLHETNAIIEGRQNIKITGCDKRTRVMPRQSRGPSRPIFLVKNSENITLQHMDLVTFDGTAIVLEGSGPEDLLEVDISHNRILAFQHAIHTSQGRDIGICHNKIRMLDREDGDVAIYLLAQDALVERNDISVVPAGIDLPKKDFPEVVAPGPTDPCFEAKVVYTQLQYYGKYASYVWALNMAALYSKDPFKALGGIRVASGSERVTIRENVIAGGAGNGITLGSDLADLVIDGDSGGEEGEIHKLEHASDAIRGDVFLGSIPLSGIALSFEGKDGTVFAMTDTNGRFATMGAKPGLYQVSVESPGYKIERIVPPAGDTEFEFHRIEVSEKEQDIDLSGLLAFIYEVLIDGNEIMNVGLSGIGVPQVEFDALTALVGAKVPRTLAGLVTQFGYIGGFIVNLAIHHNLIHHCLQNILDRAQEPTVLRRGLGGISLVLCENLIIQQNRVEDNGRNHLTPVCGIFVSYADQVDISHNRVLNNGPLDLTTREGTSVQQGIRGGVVLRLATSHSVVAPLSGTVGGGSATIASATDVSATSRASNFSVAQPAALAARAPTFNTKGRFAAHIHDNVVEQPIGRALTVWALGPVSVVGNQLSSDFAEPSARATISTTAGLATAAPTLGTLLAMAGTALIVNLGQPLHLQQWGELNSLAPNTMNLPSGNTLFNGNQVRLGAALDSPTSVIIAATDDIGFEGNQSVVLHGQVLAVNTFLFALTLRAADNRFKEPIRLGRQQTSRYSLYSLSVFMNTTAANQGDHCILVVCQDSTREIDHANLALTATPKECQPRKGGITDLLRPKMKAVVYAYGGDL